MVNNNGIPEVYQWNEVSLQWEKIGNAVGQAPESSNVYQGKEYDYVFEIELDEGSPTMRKLKLPYNKTTDPYIAAQEFLDANNLPPMYLDEVAEFIIKNAGEYQRSSAVQNYDPFTGGQAYVPEGRRQPVSGGGLDPFTGGSSYRSSGGAGNGYTGNVPVESDHHKSQVKVKNTFFPMVDYMTFSSPESYTEKVIQKIHEFNSEVAENLRISEDCLSRLPVLCKLLTTQTSSSIETEHFHVIESVLKWPVDKLFPGLDLLRLSLLHKSGNAHFTGDEDSGKVFLGELIAFAVGSQPEAKNQLLVLRCLANMFALPSSAQLMDYERKWLLSEVSPLYQSDSKPFQTALATLVLNYCHFYASKKCPDGIADCVQCCMRVLNSSFNLEAKFRAMVGIGSLATFDRALVKRSTSSVDLVSLLQPLCSVLDPSKVGNCAEVLLDVIA